MGFDIFAIDRKLFRERPCSRKLFEQTLPNTPLGSAIIDRCRRAIGSPQRHAYTHDHGLRCLGWPKLMPCNRYTASPTVKRLPHHRWLHPNCRALLHSERGILVEDRTEFTGRAPVALISNRNSRPSWFCLPVFPDHSAPCRDGPGRRREHALHKLRKSPLRRSKIC